MTHDRDALSGWDVQGNIAQYRRVRLVVKRHLIQDDVATHLRQRHRGRRLSDVRFGI